ncbi:LacI family DNA-binding transcriptional regulator [uncultured Robinsoniella sp.]|uniref:LacI family DNA-binding transcriptional regulator n=2 Tax=uncultured Robinsoniella sp. TaxID=904190 RepID=UPI00374F8146
MMSGTTIKDVARVAQVSVGTASMALNSKPGVNEETRERVLKIAQQLNYKPNPYARYLTRKKTNIIGLVVTDITNPFFGNMIDIIQQDLGSHGYDIMLGISRGSITEEKKIIQKFIDMHVDGVIAVPSHNFTSDTLHYQELQKLNIPLCFITSYYPGIEAPCVMTDLSEGSYRLTKYLLENGHQSIVYLVGNLAAPVSNLRVDGYISAFRDAHLTYQPEWIVTADVTLQGGYSATEQILSQFKPDAIITVNDFMAMGVLKSLKEHHILVPQDISVAGYDDLIYSSMLETPLTTVKQPLEQICQRTVSIFLKQLTDLETVTEKFLLKPSLIIRSSSCPHSL